MTIKQQAATALARARAAGVPLPDTGTAHLRRLRAALAREVTVMLGVPPTNVVVTDDPQRSYSGYPGQLITVHDPDDPAAVLQFIPETGNTGSGGGVFLLLGTCPGCNTDEHSGEVPVMSIASLAELALYERGRPAPGEIADRAAELRPEVPVEFFDDPGHAADCPLR